MFIEKRVSAFSDWGKVKNSLLDVGSEQAKVHNLSNSGAGDVAQARNLGHVLDLATFE